MKIKSLVSISFAIVSLLGLNSCSTDVPRQSTDNVSARGAWSTLAPMPVQIGEVTVTANGGKIYVIGGTTGDVVDQKLNQEYDVATNSWRNRAPLPRGMPAFSITRREASFSTYASAMIRSSPSCSCPISSTVRSASVA